MILIYEFIFISLKTTPFVFERERDFLLLKVFSSFHFHFKQNGFHCLSFSLETCVSFFFSFFITKKPKLINCWFRTFSFSHSFDVEQIKRREFSFCLEIILIIVKYFVFLFTFGEKISL